MLIATTLTVPINEHLDNEFVKLAKCESGLRWHIDKLFDGGLQFQPSTWAMYKPAGFPEFAFQASPNQQIRVAKIVRTKQGWKAWPVCSRKLGYG